MPFELIDPAKLLCDAGAAKSRAEARRLIQSGAVWVDNARISSVETEVSVKKDTKIRVGRNRLWGKVGDEWMEF